MTDQLETAAHHLAQALAENDASPTEMATELMTRVVEAAQQIEAEQIDESPTDANGEPLEVGDVVARISDGNAFIMTAAHTDEISCHDGSGGAASVFEKVDRLTPEQYIPLARRTMPDDLSDRERLSMLAMGVIGELGELQGLGGDTEEVGDVLWYAHLLTDECERQGVPSKINSSTANGISDTVFTGVDTACSWLVEQVKKAIYHNVQTGVLSVLAHEAIDYCEGLDFVGDFGAIRLQNAQKLFGRYPDGFTTGGGER